MPEKHPRLRQRIISSVIGILMVVGAMMAFGIISVGKEIPKMVQPEKVTSVIYAPVELKNTSVAIQSNGTLSAKNKIDIVSRTQGVFEGGDRAFRGGVYFKKGETMVAIDNDEYVAMLRASRAQLVQSITAVLGDLKFDYADAFDKWNNYVSSFDVNASLKELPPITSDRERAFITGKNIITQFYNIKAQEVQASYYRIRAPFSGILTQNLVDKGAMINPGQALGTFIDPSVFELEVKISPSELELVTVGKSVAVSNGSKDKSWTGKVSRINTVIDPQSQSALAIVEVRGKDLKEGMFLQTEISTVDLVNVAEVARNLLIDDQYVYLVAENLLKKQAVEVLHVADKTVFVKGLTAGAWLLDKPVSGAFDGMKVKPINLSE